MKSYMHLIAILAFSFLTQNALAETPAEQACNTADQTHLRPNNHHFADSLYDCSGIGGLDLKCFNKAYPGMGENCMGCYARLTKCTISWCAGTCMWDGRGKSCRDCSQKHCGTKLEKCIGLSFDHSPDFDRSQEG